MDKLNRAKGYQLVLFPFNNGATNVYYILTMNYIMYHANGVLGLAIAFATSMVTVMRVFDAFTDPIIGMIIDRTNGRFGKFRPYMVLGNVTMIICSLLMYFGTRLIPASHMGLRYAAYTIIYIIFIIGYTLQTSCTRAGQTCITNDPQQRPTFTIFNTIASLVGMGLIQMVAALVGGKVGYGSTQFFDILIPLAIILSVILTILALVGIWEKDRPEFYGIASEKKEKVKISEYINILKNNHELQRLVIAGAGTKLAFAIATNTAVGCLLFGSLMGNYQGLFLPFYIIGYVFSVPFFLIGLKTSQKHGQKATLVRFTSFAFIMYIGVLALMLMWQPNGNLALSFSHFNWYTLLFAVIYGLGYGAYYSTADMSIPMVADCSDYEIYRSGNYVPGIIGTLFSLVDKLVSSFSTTIVGLCVVFVGLNGLPDANTPYADGMKGLTIVLFCIVPMLAWLATLIAMKGYKLTGEKMKEIQTVNAARKEAVEKGMSLEEAMAKYQTTEDIH
jgi:Na+/melibiose symporter-like transporter